MKRLIAPSVGSTKERPGWIGSDRAAGVRGRGPGGFQSQPRYTNPAADVFNAARPPCRMRGRLSLSPCSSSPFLAVL
jgi:hypothetical protein